MVDMDKNRRGFGSNDLWLLVPYDFLVISHTNVVQATEVKKSQKTT